MLNELVNINNSHALEKVGYQYFSAARILRKAERLSDFFMLSQASKSMPKDPHLNAGEGHRYRYYARYVFDPKSSRLAIFENAPFFQSKEFDLLYGDIHRQFARLPEPLILNNFLQELIIEDYYRFPIQTLEPFEISLHLIRIEADSKEKSGRPAPEGIHQDGYHYGAIHLIERNGVNGARNRIHDLQKKQIDEMTLTNPLDSILFDDRKIYHSVSPFEPISNHASRCMLILLFQPLRNSPQVRQRRPRVLLEL